MQKKTYQGPIKNKERTKQKFLDAVGEIIAAEGYTGLGANKIARQAGMNKSLIYSYFGSVNNLIQQYVRLTDYWILSDQKVLAFLEEQQPGQLDLIKFILSNQMEFFSSNTQMQKFIVWQISEKSQVMNEVAMAREKLGAEYFKATDKLFSEKTDFRAISAIFVSSIYYLTLFAKNNTSTFCEIDLNKKNEMDRITKAMFNILEILLKNELNTDTPSA